MAMPVHVDDAEDMKPSDRGSLQQYCYQRLDRITRQIRFVRLRPGQGESLKRYRYQRLDHSTRQIRLIKLRPDEGGLPACDMATFDLSSAPPFIALSYTWGPPSPQFDILVNGEPLSIRENLFQFLKAFMMTTERDWTWMPLRDNYLWIDQICIDQSSISERNHQVGMMASIYSGCFDTIIWLGSIHNDPDAPCIIKNMGHSSTPMEDILHAGASIAENDYFSRLWIVQEMMLSRKKRVLCSHPSVGAVWVDWVSLIFIARHSKYRAPSIAAGFLLRELAQDMMSLLHAVCIFSQSHCQDPRDKVYGLMGLVKEEERITIDYAKPLEEIFLELMIACNKHLAHQTISSNTEYQDALVNLGKSWDIMSGSLTAVLKDMWFEPVYNFLYHSSRPEEWHPNIGRDEPQPVTYPQISAMGFLPKARHKNGKSEEGRFPYQIPDELKAMKDCWWYQIDDTIYHIYGMVKSIPRPFKITEPAYHGKKLWQAQTDILALLVHVRYEAGDIWSASLFGDAGMESTNANKEHA